MPSLKTRPNNKPVNKNNSSINPTLIIGILGAVISLFLIGLFLNSVNSTTQVYVAKGNISPYNELVVNNNIVTKDVPSNSIEDTDLTVDKYNELTDNNQIQLVNRTEMLNGQRISIQAISDNSFNVVKEDEQVLAITTSYPGSGAGAISPGNIITLYNSQDGNIIAERIKLLGLGENKGAVNSVNQEDNQQENNKQQNTEGNIIAYIAITPDQASEIIAAQSTYMGLDTYYTFDAQGTVCLRSDVSENLCPDSDSITETPKKGTSTTEENSGSSTTQEDTSTTEELPQSPLQE